MAHRARVGRTGRNRPSQKGGRNGSAEESAVRQDSEQADPGLEEIVRITRCRAGRLGRTDEGGRRGFSRGEFGIIPAYCILTDSVASSAQTLQNCLTNSAGARRHSILCRICVYGCFPGDLYEERHDGRV